jgi:hypothetical protein
MSDEDKIMYTLIYRNMIQDLKDLGASRKRVNEMVDNIDIDNEDDAIEYEWVKKTVNKLADEIYGKTI